MVNLIFIFLAALLFFASSLINGFLSVVLIYCFVMYLFFLQWYASRNVYRVRETITKMIANFQMYEFSIQKKMFFRGEMSLRTSAFQVVFYAEGEQYKYWFVGGGFFSGCLRKVVKMYRVEKLNGKTIELIGVSELLKE